MCHSCFLESAPQAVPAAMQEHSKMSRADGELVASLFVVALLDVDEEHREPFEVRLLRDAVGRLRGLGVEQWRREAR
jgi:hypothetical protein